MAELVKPDQKMDNLRKFFDTNKAKIAAILPKHFSLDRQGQLLFTAVYRNPDLLDCTPASLVGAIMQGGMFGLEPVGPGGYWLVPFWQKANPAKNIPARRNVTMIIDYRGLMAMTRRTKEVKVVDWRAVREGDKFEYEYGSAGFLRHKPDETPIHQGKDERAITHFYAYAVLASGATVFEVMRREDVEWHRDRYSKAAGSGPWVTNFDEMGAKTCARKLSDKLPFDALVSMAVSIEAKNEQGIDTNFAALLGEIGSDEGGGNGGSKLDRAREEMEARDAKAAEAAKSQETVTTASGATVDPSTGEVKPHANEDPKPSDAATSRAGSVAGTGGGGVATDSTVQAAPAAGVSPFTPHGLIDAINQAYADLDMSGPKDAGKRAWMWERFVGKDVGVEVAPTDKLQTLLGELNRQKAARTPKKK